MSKKTKGFSIFLALLLFISVVFFSTEVRFAQAKNNMLQLHIEKTIEQVKETIEKQKKSEIIKKKKPKWKYLGECRVTTYCPYCNDGDGHDSSSGKYLEDGDCACSWLPIGTKIKIAGRIYRVVDICGTNAIDLYIDHNEGYCICNLNEYRKVMILCSKN